MWLPEGGCRRTSAAFSDAQTISLHAKDGNAALMCGHRHRVRLKLADAPPPRKYAVNRRPLTAMRTVPVTSYSRL